MYIYIYVYIYIGVTMSRIHIKKKVESVNALYCQFRQRNCVSRYLDV